MADNILKAVIDVQAPNAAQTFQIVSVGVSVTERNLSKLQKQLIAFGGGVNTFTNNFKVIPQAFSKIPPAVESANAALRKLPQTSNTATQSLINLGRVVQDAPFGFLGIANNLNPLLESFQRLRATTNTSGEAFKALGKSLLGAGGLGFALSLVSSALIVFGNELFGSATASKASEEALERLAAQMDRVKSSVKSLSDELQFANQIGSLDIKIRGASDLTDLLEQSFAQRSFTQDLRKQMNELRLIGEEIAKNEDLNGEDRKKAIKDNDQEIQDLNDKIIESERKQQVIYKQIGLQKVNDQKDADEKRLKAYNEYLRKLKELADFEEALRKHLAERIKKIFDAKFNTTELDQKARINLIADINLDTISTNFGEPARKISTDIQSAVVRLTKANPILIRANVKIELTAQQKQIQEAAENISATIKQTFTDSFVALGEGLGEVLAGGDVQKAFAGFASVIGGALKAIGEQLIAIGTAAIAVKVSLGQLFANPFLAIAAGIALTAIGAAMQSAINKGFAGGGYTGDGGKYEPAGIVHKGEFVIPKQTVDRLGVGYLNNLAFGNGVRGYANGGLVSSGISGSGISIVVTGQSLTKGQDIVTVYKAALRSQSRLT